MKKFISLFIATFIMVGALAGCGSSSSSNTNTSDTTDTETSSNDDTISIVTTIFPEYDWVMSILGDNPANAEVTMLLDNGVDLHSYQPTAEDIMTISTCDLFIYVGGESDSWGDAALAQSTNPDMVVINLLDVLGDSVKEEEVVEGMEAEEEHDHDETEESADSDEEEVEYDEHVWLSLKNAAILVDSISSAIQEIDADNADTYSANTTDYIAALNDLDALYEEAVAAGSVSTLVFGDRFPFRYLVDDYGLSYYAAFVGCSAESEASFETITFLAGKVDELSLNTVLTIEGTDHSIAETIVENTTTKDQQILSMDSMQSTTSEDVANGATYLSIMESNLEVLKKALN